MRLGCFRALRFRVNLALVINARGLAGALDWLRRGRAGRQRKKGGRHNQRGSEHPHRQRHQRRKHRELYKNKDTKEGHRATVMDTDEEAMTAQA